MKKQIVALILLFVLLLPMYAGIEADQNLPRDTPQDEDPPKP